MEEVKKKKCSKCGEEKPATNEYFGNVNRNKDGLHNVCKKCRSEIIKEKTIKREKIKLTNMTDVEKDEYIKIKYGGYKKCPMCKKVLLANTENFNSNKARYDGITTYCKKCSYKKTKKYMQKSNNKVNNYKVYAHINKINGKIYVGQTKKAVSSRWGRGSGYINTPIFYKAIEKYGWDNFDHEIIAGNLTKEEAENFEMLLIEKLETQNRERGYNIQIGGTNGHKGLTGSKNHRSKEIYCNGEIFKGIDDFMKKYNLTCDRAVISHWLCGTNGMPKEFIDLNLHYIGEEYKIKPQNRKGYKVISKKDNVIFDSVRKCSEYYNLGESTLRLWLNGELSVGKSRLAQTFKELGLEYHKQENTQENK